MVNTEYEKALQLILDTGSHKSDRTGTGTTSLFGHQMKFDLQEGFPLITTKKVHLKSVIHELLWFLQGTGNIAYLKEHNVKIWDAWADANGDLGPVYGVMWRSWPNLDGTTTDQVNDVIEQIKVNPDSRRLIINAWNPSLLSEQALPPCHLLSQFYVVDGKLSCQLYQRSADMFLGVPFNIASYALLTHMIAQQTGLEVGDFVWTGGDAHIYDNHQEQVALQLTREARPFPQLILNKADSIDSYKYEDVVIEGYDPHPAIKGDVAV